MGEILRNEKGHFLPNQGSPNPSGRRSTKDLIALIKNETNDGLTLVKRLVDITEGKSVSDRKPNVKDIINATELLLAYTFGKPVSRNEIDVKNEMQKDIVVRIVSSEDVLKQEKEENFIEVDYNEA